MQYLAGDQENEMLNELFKSMQHNMSDTARCMFLNQLPPLTKGEEYQTRQREGGGGVPKGGSVKTRVISSKSTIGNSVYVLAVM